MCDTGWSLYDSEHMSLRDSSLTTVLFTIHSKHVMLNANVKYTENCFLTPQSQPVTACTAEGAPDEDRHIDLADITTAGAVDQQIVLERFDVSHLTH